MAVIESRTSQSGAKSWRVKIRIKGNPQISATFKRRTDAKQWAAKTESSEDLKRLVGSRIELEKP